MPLPELVQFLTFLTILAGGIPVLLLVSRPLLRRQRRLFRLSVAASFLFPQAVLALGVPLPYTGPLAALAAAGALGAVVWHRVARRPRVVEWRAPDFAGRGRAA